MGLWGNRDPGFQYDWSTFTGDPSNPDDVASWQQDQQRAATGAGVDTSNPDYRAQQELAARQAWERSQGRGEDPRFAQESETSPNMTNQPPQEPGAPGVTQQQQEQPMADPNVGVPPGMERFYNFLDQAQNSYFQDQRSIADLYGINKGAIEGNAAIGANLGGLADYSRGIATGGADPRFAEYQAGQFGVMDANQQAQERATQAAMARRGVGGSVGLNEMNKIRGGFDTQRQALSGTLGLQQMGRQDTMLDRAGGFYGQQGQFNLANAGLTGAQADLIGKSGAITNTLLQNTLIDPTMRMAYLAAQNAGKNPGGGGGGGQGFWANPGAILNPTNWSF